ncbi:TPA: hypothetical protein N2G30_003948 [Salmonella enterica]|nr:hypothetical protein [Salmonella enterica]
MSRTYTILLRKKVKAQRETAFPLLSGFSASGSHAPMSERHAVYTYS